MDWMSECSTDASLCQVSRCVHFLTELIVERAQGYTFDIRADDLDTFAAPTFDNMLKDRYDAVWQNLPVKPRTCPSEGAACLYIQPLQPATAVAYCRQECAWIHALCRFHCAQPGLISTVSLSAEHHILRPPEGHSFMLYTIVHFLLSPARHLGP